MQSSRKIYHSLTSGHGPKTRAYLALATVCFFWGTTWIAAKIGVTRMPALQLAGIRQLAGGLLYLAYFMTKGRIFPTLKELRPILILSFLNFMLSNAFATWGVQYIPAGLASIIGATFPLWIVLIGLISTKNRISAKAVTGFAIGFVGICVIFFEHLHHFLETQFLLGIFLSLAATWSWAAGTIYTKKQAKNFNPYFSLGWQMVIAGIVLMISTKSTGFWMPLKDIPYQSWLSIAYLVIFSSVITFIAFLYALQHLTAEQTSVYAYINPIIAVLFGALIFGEKLTVFIAIGGAIIIYGTYLINSAYRKQE